MQLIVAHGGLLAHFMEQLLGSESVAASTVAHNASITTIEYEPETERFTLVELIVVLVILAILAAFMIPALIQYIERSLEASDLIEVRAAYIDVLTAVTEQDSENMSKTVKLKQKQDDWQSRDPITIAGVTHYKDEGDTANWKGTPAAGGECKVYYDSAAAVIVFDWKGKSTAGSTIKWDEKLHDILDRTGILKTLKYNQYFEIDSKCPNSSMVPQVEQQIKSDSLLNKYMGVSRQFHEREQPLFVLDIGRYRYRRCGQADTGHCQPGERRLLHLRNDYRGPEQQGQKLCCDCGPYQQFQHL